MRSPAESERSISPMSSTSAAATPRPNTGTETTWSARLVRFSEERKAPLVWIWKPIAMRTSPIKTGSRPKSPGNRSRNDQPPVFCASSATSGSSDTIADVAPGTACDRSTWSPGLSMLMPFHVRSGNRAGSLVDVAKLRACDGRDHLLWRGRADVVRSSAPPQTQDDHPVHHLEHVGQVVRDDDDGQSALAQPPDEVEHLACLCDTQRRRGLVQQHYLGVAQDRLGDRDGLPLAARERCHRHAHRFDRPHFELAQHVEREPLHVRLVQHPAKAWDALHDVFATQMQICDYIGIVGQCQVLKDRLNAQPRSFGLRPDRALTCFT